MASPIFARAKIYSTHGRTKEFYDDLVVNIHCVNSRSGRRYLYQLGMAYVNSTIYMHILR